MKGNNKNIQKEENPASTRIEQKRTVLAQQAGRGFAARRPAEITVRTNYTTEKFE
jgi:hypothetical protein